MTDPKDRKEGKPEKRFPEDLGQDDGRPGIGEMVIGKTFVIGPNKGK